MNQDCLGCGRQRRVRAQRNASPWRSALRSDFPAMLGWPGRRRTRCVRCALYAQTAATSQMTMRVSFGTRARPPCASRRPGGALRWARTRLCWTERAGIDASCADALSTRQAIPGRGDFRGGEKRRPGLGARSALRGLTRRSCLSEAAEGRAVSSATQAPAEHRSGVGAQRRPPRYEPLTGTACRGAPRPSSHRASEISNTCSHDEHVRCLP